jgi:hypothetical protein
MKGILAGSLGLALCLAVQNVRAGDGWQPAGTSAIGVQAAAPTEADRAMPKATLGRPVAVTLGRPVALEPSPVTYVARAQAPDAGAPIPAAPGAAATPAEQFNCGVVTQPPASGNWFMDGLHKMWNAVPGVNGNGFGGGGRCLFQSDSEFHNLVSPVTNPFYFEDPRSLTEVRPIFIYQEAPTKNSVFHGGDMEYFGVQARVAFTERLSLVVSELGVIWDEPHASSADFQPHSGFAEIHLGPKYTFYRCEQTGTIAAAGLTFEIPAGDKQVHQDTGDLSLVPYLSAGQSFFKSSYGTFDALGTIGYDFGVDDKRSDHFFLNLHLDYDYGNLHVIYPFIEMTWYYYAQNGKVEPINFEGRDLFNFGAEHVSGHNEVELALGARYKLNDHIQFGGAFELPVTSDKDLMAWRLTFDVIFRY